MKPEDGVRKAGEWVCVGHVEFDGSLGLRDVYRTVRYVGLKSEKKAVDRRCEFVDHQHRGGG